MMSEYNSFKRTYTDLLDKHRKYTTAGGLVKKNLEDEREQAEKALEELALEQKTLCETSLTKSSSAAVFVGVISPETIASYLEYLKLRGKIRARLDELDLQLRDVGAKFGRSAYRDGSGFYGVTDYSQWALLKYGPICDAIGTASVFGAGITYTTIFSAPRGSIGLMCWSFALFNVGFVIITLIQSLLRSTSNLPLPTKATVVKFYWLPFVWEIVLHLVILLAFSCVTAAVLLLSVTVLRLPWSPTEAMLSNISIDVPIWLAVVLSIAATGGGVVITFLVGLLYVAHFGVRVGKNDEVLTVATPDRFL